MAPAAAADDDDPSADLLLLKVLLMSILTRFLMIWLYFSVKLRRGPLLRLTAAAAAAGDVTAGIATV